MQGKLLVGGDEFLCPEEESKFEEMLEQRDKSSVFSLQEIGCIDPTPIESMVISTIPHVLWKLIELLKDKVKMRILESFNRSYSNRWFTVLKKIGTL